MARSKLYWTPTGKTSSRCKSRWSMQMEQRSPSQGTHQPRRDTTFGLLSSTSMCGTGNGATRTRPLCPGRVSTMKEVPASARSDISTAQGIRHTTTWTRRRTTTTRSDSSTASLSPCSPTHITGLEPRMPQLASTTRESST